ncbi:MAG: D-alanyl-D-alanine carboxypeptidase family protein [Bacillota bacterium]
MFISKKRLRYMTASVTILVGLSFTIYLAVRNTGYQVEAGFPRMVYVPGYYEGPKVTADSAVLIDEESGAIMFAKNEHIRRAPASTTKIVTALLAIEYGKMNEIVTVSPRAASVGGTSIWLRPGDKLMLSELIKGILMRSGNDGSTAIAEHLAGSEREFAAIMTMKAREMGALNTQFRNAHGLRAAGHYSTAYDLAVLARNAMQNKTFASLVSTRESQLTWEEKEQVRALRNTNRLLWTLDGADGVKTGTTNQAGRCLVASATRGGRRLIAVVLHSDDRWGDAIRLLEYGFQNFSLCWGAREGQVVARVPVKGGNTRELWLVPRSALCVPVRNDDSSSVRRVLEVPEQVSAPIRKGAVVGRVSLVSGDSELYSVDLIAANAVKRRFLWWKW